MATVAVFLALGGGAYAVSQLPKNSVGSRQLKKHAVTPSKVAPKTITLFKGQKGDPGRSGAPGSAVAYAAVDSTGHIDPANSKGVSQAMVVHHTTSFYCFSDPRFTPHAFSVTPQTPNVTPSVSAPVPTSSWLLACGSGVADGPGSFFVEFRNTSGTPVDSGFWLTIN